MTTLVEELFAVPVTWIMTVTVTLSSERRKAIQATALTRGRHTSTPAVPGPCCTHSRVRQSGTRLAIAFPSQGRHNDGFSDIVVGAWGNDAGGFDAGRAYVFLCPITCSCLHQGDIANRPAGDGVIDVFDVIELIGIAFSGAADPQDPQCPKTRGDVDNSGVSDVFDVIYLIATAFSGGAAPVNPCAP